MAQGTDISSAEEKSHNFVSEEILQVGNASSVQQDVLLNVYAFILCNNFAFEANLTKLVIIGDEQLTQPKDLCLPW